MVQNKVIIDKEKRKVIKIATDDIQKVQLQAEGTIYSYADKLIKLPHILLNYPKFLKKEKII